MSEADLRTSLQDGQKPKTVPWAGTWHLAPGRAMSLLPRKSSQLWVVQGCAWITWDKPMGHWAQSGTDHFLEAGQIMDVPAGVRLVMEARHAHEALHFDWREIPPCLAPQHAPAYGLPELLQQWLQACGVLAWATGRLLRGLWRRLWGAPQVCDLSV